MFYDISLQYKRIAIKAFAKLGERLLTTNDREDFFIFQKHSSPLLIFYNPFLKNKEMNEIKTLNHGEKFAHASVGKLEGFEGKLFMKDAIGSTSCEVSFGALPHGAAVPFFHSHKENEETYIILSGKGRFQVDDEVFEVGEGSVIRVSIGCDRNIKCTSDNALTYICIQAKEGSLEHCTATDAVINERESLL